MVVDRLPTFVPDWVSPPGETISDLLEERDWTQVQLAERLGYTPKHVNLLINGKVSITEEAALKKELLQFFGVASPEDWGSYYAGMNVAFRSTKETQSGVGAISAWLRCGEIEAEHLDCPKYNKAKFEKAVQVIRSLTLLSQEEAVPQMQQLCQRAGVVFVLVPSIPRAHISGLARWLNPSQGLNSVVDVRQIERPLLVYVFP